MKSDAKKFGTILELNCSNNSTKKKQKSLNHGGKKKSIQKKLKLSTQRSK